MNDSMEDMLEEKKIYQHQAKGNICFSYNGPGTAKRLTEVELYLLGIPAWMIYAVACALYHFYKTNISEFGNKSSCQDFDH